MALRDTDYLLVERGGTHYKTTVSTLTNFISSAVIVSPTVPENPMPGQLWYDNKSLYVWEVLPEPKWVAISNTQSLGYESTNIDNKLSEIYSVKDFGAKGDGVVDDTISIQNAINEATPWGKVWFPKGTYKVTNFISIPTDSAGNSGLTICGEGYASKLVSAGNHAIFKGEASYVTFRDLTFDGNSTFPDKLKYGIEMSEGRTEIGSSPYVNLNVINCLFTNLYTGIGASVPYCNIVGNKSSQVLRFFMSEDNGSNSIFSDNVYNVTPFSGIYPTNPSQAVHFRSAKSKSSIPSNIQIYGNRIRNNLDYKNATGIFVSGVNNISIFNNIVECISNTTGDATVGAITIRTRDIMSIRVPLHNITVRNNYIKSPPRGFGLHIYSTIMVGDVSIERIKDVNIDGNVFASVDGSGKAIWMSGIDNYSIVNNTIQGTSVDGNIGSGYTGGPTYITDCTAPRFYNNRDKFLTGDPITCPFRSNTFFDETLFTAGLKASIGSSDANSFLKPTADYNELTSNQLQPVVNIEDYSTKDLYRSILLHQRNINVIGSRNWKLWSSFPNTFSIYGNGDIVNKNKVFATISDETKKENIIPIQSQWNDVKSIKVRSYRMKGQEDIVQLGVIAQEAEEVSPELVFETQDRDLYSGCPLPTTTKHFAYSILYLKAVGALQEAMKRIEELENQIDEIEMEISK